MSDNIIKVLLTDDQTLIRDGIRSILKDEKSIIIVDEASNGMEACEKARELKPDVILMDIRMPEMNGVEATGIIKKELPETKIIILTTFDDDDYIIKAMSYGASGYLLKDINSEGLISAIKNSLSGNVILPGKIAARITSKLDSGSHEAEPVGLDDFTEREIDIIRLMSKGFTNSQIAGELYLTNGTVKNYVSQIYMKINVKDRTNAILYFKNKLNL